MQASLQAFDLRGGKTADGDNLIKRRCGGPAIFNRFQLALVRILSGAHST